MLGYPKVWFTLESLGAHPWGYRPLWGEGDNNQNITMDNQQETNIYYVIFFNDYKWCPGLITGEEIVWQMSERHWIYLSSPAVINKIADT